MNLGIVTCNRIPELIHSEQPLLSLFSERGINARAVVWNDQDVVWDQYDLLIIRSIWDYHLFPEDFTKWLYRIENSNVRVLNPISLLSINKHKFYLKDLALQGFKIAPTIFLKKGTSLKSILPNFQHWDKIVIKPAISASAFLTSSFSKNEFDQLISQYSNVLLERDLLVQKFIPEIQSFGELSIIFFNKNYIHTVIKKPKPNEFRVQSEYGGTFEFYFPNQDIIDTASRILNYYNQDILYARVDGTIINGKFVLMEIELIEPDLFFNLNEGALELFVQATLKMTNSPI